MAKHTIPNCMGSDIVVEDSFVVFAKLGDHDSWACNMWPNTPACLERAKHYARSMFEKGWKNVRLREVTDPQALLNAEFQIEKLRDWESD